MMLAVLQATINHLDDPQIDFYIHWDQRYPLSQLKSSYSKIIFIKERQAVTGELTHKLRRNTV